MPSLRPSEWNLPDGLRRLSELDCRPVWIDFLCRWIDHHVHAGRSEQLRGEGRSDPVADLVGNRGSSGLVSKDLPRPDKTKCPSDTEGFSRGTVWTVIERKSLDSAEDIGAQELVLKFSLRIVFPAQFYECGQTTITGVQLFWRERKQLSPVRTRIKWCQFLFDHR